MDDQNHKPLSDTAGSLQEKHRPGYPVSSIGDASWFAPALTAVYALVLFYAMLHHEMWRDEIQPWLLARDSAGVLDLLRNMKYEGHPPLWHLLLMPITRLTSSPFAMQILHLAIASTTVFVIAKYAPFKPLHKILLVFGYFPLYEYGLISRHYALALLLVVVTCVLLKQRHQKPLRLALALFLMSYTHVLACIVAISVMAGLALEYFLNRQTLAEDRTVNLRRNYAGFALAAAGILLSMLQMNPAADAPRGGWFLALDHWRGWEIAMNALGAFSAGLGLDSAQTQLARSYFTETMGLDLAGPDFSPGLATPLKIILPMAVAGALATPIACYWKKPAALAIYLCCITGLLTFSYMVSLHFVRHYGFLLIAILLLVWSGRYFTFRFRNQEREEGNTSPPAASPVIGTLLTVFLAVHAFSGLKAVADDVERPFSFGKQTAAYIEAEGLDSLPMIGERDYIASTVVGHLQRKRKIHYAKGNREGSFVRWDTERLKIDDATLLAQTQALATRAGGRVLMILNRPLSTKPVAGRTIRALASFRGDAIISDSEYHLYLYETSANAGQSRS